MWAVLTFLVLQIGAGTRIVQQAGASDIVRIVGLLVITPLALKSNLDRPRFAVADDAFQARDSAFFQRFIAGYVLWAVVSTVPHAGIGQFASHIGGSVLLLVAARALYSDRGLTVRRALPIVLAATVCTSVVLGVLDPTQAIAGGRLRGLFVNANLLGFYAFILLIVVLLSVQSRFWRISLIGLSIVAIGWTGSRASAAAALVGVALAAVSGHRHARLLFLSIAIGLLVVMSVDTFALTEHPLLGRELSTRDGSLEEALRVASVSPFFGVGEGGELREVASSPLRAFVRGGIIALIGVTTMYVVLLREAIRRGSQVFALSSAAILHSFGEGWLLSALGGMTIVFIAAFIGVSSVSAVQHSGNWKGAGRRSSHV